MDRSDARSFFRSRVEDYERTHYGDGTRSFMSVRLARILEAVDALSLPPGSPVLDAGCGPGHLVAALLRRELSVCAVDTSRPMLDRTAARAADAGAAPPRLELASIDALPFRDASFALVCSAGVLEYLERDEVALAEWERVLRPGGHLVLPVTNAWSPALYGDFLIESLKRVGPLRRGFNALWQRRGHAPVRARAFRVRRHRPARLRAALRRAGFELVDGSFFYFLPWPHPVDRFLPAASDRLGERLERHGRGALGPLGEGYLAVARKPHG